MGDNSEPITKELIDFVVSYITTDSSKITVLEYKHIMQIARDYGVTPIIWNTLISIVSDNIIDKDLIWRELIDRLAAKGYNPKESVMIYNNWPKSKLKEWINNNYGGGEWWTPGVN